MSDITDRLRSLARYEHADLSIGDEAADEIELLRRHVERLRKRDMEAATYVESVICMRTHFTGEPPYIGWQGLGLALREALDERDRLREENDRMKRVIGRESINVGPAGSGGENPQSL